MTSAIERDSAIAREIIDRRDPYGTELRDNAFCAVMLAEAYARGYVAGLEQAQATFSVVDAGEAVRAELEAARKQLDADDAPPGPKNVCNP